MGFLAPLAAGLSAIGSIAGGVMQNNESQYEAKQADQNATLAVAASQRKAEATTRETNQLIGQQRAAGAASGYGGATDASTLELIGATEKEGTLRQMTDLYEGQEQARGFKNQAAASRMEGRNALIGGVIGGATSIAKGAAGWNQTYG